jgi:DNA repair photolyase
VRETSELIPKFPFYQNQLSDDPNYLRGRGAQFNQPNKFLKHHYVDEEIDGQSEPLILDPRTQFIPEYPRKILNKVDSPDLPMNWSMNPYQGCEHGCIYCYARNTHTFWGYSAGLDFEQKIIYKPDASALLEKAFRHPKWKPEPIMFAGNTDCYQPAERKFEITRRMLEVLWKFRHPVGIITKNSLVLRDLDLLAPMAAKGLVHVAISITTLDESLRLKMEPRTATAKRRLETIRQLTAAGIPSMVMAAPIIPGLNSHEINDIIEAAAQAGALTAGYTMVRLNGDVAPLFTDWVHKNFPDRAEKVLHQIADVHGGQLEDNRFGSRMRGEGNIAMALRDLFRAARKKHMSERELPDFNLSAFRVPPQAGDQLPLF